MEQRLLECKGIGMKSSNLVVSFHGRVYKTGLFVSGISLSLHGNHVLASLIYDFLFSELCVIGHFIKSIVILLMLQEKVRRGLLVDVFLLLILLIQSASTCNLSSLQNIFYAKNDNLRIKL